MQHVQIVVRCARGHKLMAFFRDTFPGSKNDGVGYRPGGRGRFVTMAVDVDDQGPDWRQIDLFCQTPADGAPCGCHVEIGRARIEAMLTAMWKPGARGSEDVVWDAPK